MSDKGLVTRLFSRVVLALALLSGGILPGAAAAGKGQAARVVDVYLASLASGDIEEIRACIDGRMKSRNKALEQSPGTYSEFLRQHYQGVDMAVEEISREGEAMRARVRFDYPTSDSAVVVFILTQQDGAWKITDEEY